MPRGPCPRHVFTHSAEAAGRARGASSTPAAAAAAAMCGMNADGEVSDPNRLFQDGEVSGPGHIASTTCRQACHREGRGAGAEASRAARSLSPAGTSCDPPSRQGRAASGLLQGCFRAGALLVRSGGTGGALAGQYPKPAVSRRAAGRSRHEGGGRGVWPSAVDCPSKVPAARLVPTAVGTDCPHTDGSSAPAAAVSPCSERQRRRTSGASPPSRQLHVCRSTPRVSLYTVSLYTACVALHRVALHRVRVYRCSRRCWQPPPPAGLVASAPGRAGRDLADTLAERLADSRYAARDVPSQDPAADCGALSPPPSGARGERDCVRRTGRTTDSARGWGGRRGACGRAGWWVRVRSDPAGARRSKQEQAGASRPRARCCTCRLAARDGAVAIMGGS